MRKSQHFAGLVCCIIAAMLMLALEQPLFGNAFKDGGAGVQLIWWGMKLVVAVVAYTLTISNLRKDGEPHLYWPPTRSFPETKP
jgi:hypothetical protein